MEHHGDDVCGGSCVVVWGITRDIPTVGNLQGGSFSFPPESIVVKLLILARVLAKGVESFN